MPLVHPVAAHEERTVRPEHWRPDYQGLRRSDWYPFVLWRDRGGVVHEANLYSNHALCELWIADPRLLIIEMVAVASLDAAVTCLPCVAWREQQCRDDAHRALRRRRLADGLRLARGARAPGLTLVP